MRLTRCEPYHTKYFGLSEYYIFFAAKYSIYPFSVNRVYQDTSYLFQQKTGIFFALKFENLKLEIFFLRNGDKTMTERLVILLLTMMAAIILLAVNLAWTNPIRAVNFITG